MVKNSIIPQVVIFLSFVLFSCRENKKEKEFQENIEANTSITKDIGWYIDTCMSMVLEDIQSHGLAPGDFRILSFSSEDALNTIPRDTSGKFYFFEVIYAVTKDAERETRAASYLVNFDKKIIRVYDVNTKDKKAEKQIEGLKENLIRLKEALEKMPDSIGSELETIKQKLKSL
jgi:vacuolar-type H+-ATPase subunit I/STV1